MKLNKAKRRPINYWILCIVIGILLFIGNILVLVFVKGDSKTAWLTLIGGWISGIATLIIGIIASMQSSTFTKLSKKDNLINRITNYISEFQIGLITYIGNDSVSNMYTDFLIWIVYNKINSEADQKKSLIINGAWHIQQSLMCFETILVKGFYSSNATIELHNEIKKLAIHNDEMVHHLMNNEYDNLSMEEQVKDYHQAMKQLKAIQDKTQLIILDYQSLHSKILNEDNLDSIYQDIENNTKQISEYFRSNFSDDIDQPINKEN